MSDKYNTTIARAVRTILEELGYDPEDQHMVKTPMRVAKVMELFHANGYLDFAADDLLQAVFDDEHNSLVLVGPITVTSMCAHHMLPVTGYAWVGYIPNEKVVGLSKLARIVKHYAQRFTIQERVTQNVVDALMRNLEPLGAMCVIDATHGCMTIRGVKEAHATTITSAVRGVFQDDPIARQEFLTLMSQTRKGNL